jgi:hypothetical protein
MLFESSIERPDYKCYFSKKQNILVLHQDDRLSFFDMKTYKHMGDINYLRSESRGLRFERDRPVWYNTKTGEPIVPRSIRSVTINPDSRSNILLAVNNEIHDVLVDWDAKPRRQPSPDPWETRSVIPHASGISALTFHDDGKHVAVRLGNGNVFIQNLATKQMRPMKKSWWQIAWENVQ